MPSSTPTKRFRIAFSFAGEKREFVAKVAAILANCFGEDKILYDKFHRAEFATADLAFDLPTLYKDDADLIVAVFCPHYETKEWCGLEWRAIFSIIKGGGAKSVMLSRFERADGKGLHGLGGPIDLDNETPKQFAELIVERLALNEGLPKDHYTKLFAKKLTDPNKPIATPYEYFKALNENFSTYENLGLPPPANAEGDGEKDVRIAIRDLYVQPTCTPARVSPEEFDAALLAGKNPATPLLPVLAGENRRIVLLADPGMGKSTLIQWLITTLAEEAPLRAELAGLRGAIPMPFILRDLVAHLPKEAKKWDWPALLKAFASYHPRSANRPPLAAALTSDETYFRTLLASERAFLLIDGLDEIGDPVHRRALRDALWQGFEQYPNARWLVTSRWVGYEEATVHIERKLLVPDPGYERGMRELALEADQAQRIKGVNKETIRAIRIYLAPFDNDQQSAFAQNWYLPRMGETVGKEHAAAFVKAVREHSSVSVIGRVPNLLYLLAILYRNRVRLPHGRAQVYSAISEAYLGGIDLTKHLHVPYELVKKERLLATIARHMQERRAAQAEKKDKRDGSTGDILAKREELEKWLAPHFPGAEGCDALHAFVDHVAKRSGLLLPRGEGLFGFAHLSFQEYYAACWLEEEFARLSNEGEDGFLQPEPASIARKQFSIYAAQPVWREPLVFLVEKLSAQPSHARKVINWLFPQLAKPLPKTKKGKRASELMPIEAARLLAALSLDPQVALTPEQRQRIWEILWRANLAEHETGDWHISPVLLGASDFQPQVWRALVATQPEDLNLAGCTGIVDLSSLAGLANLRSLNLIRCTGVEDLIPLAGLKRLQTLELIGCTDVADFSPLAGLANLKYLGLRGCTRVENLSSLAGLVNLQTLDLIGCTSVTDLSPLAGLANLQKLELVGCNGIADFSPLAGLANLQWLNLNNCTGVVKLSILSGLANLRWLDLSGCTGSADLTPLLGLANLETLDLRGWTDVADLTPLSRLTKFRWLGLNGCTRIADLSPLAALANLQYLVITGCTGLTAQTVVAFRKSHPDTSVISDIHEE